MERSEITSFDSVPGKVEQMRDQQRGRWAEDSQFSDKTLSYFEQRMQELGIKQEDIPVIMVEYDHPAYKFLPVFSENKHGDIEIVYDGLAGVHTYLSGKKEKVFVRTRLHPDRCTKDQKYHTPKGAGTQVFLPPLILGLYRDKKPVPTLVITEGEFKAYKACMHGLPCIGIPGIHNVYEKDEQGNVLLNSELLRIIIECQVQNVVFLLDADCLDITYEEGKDLHKRLHSFYSAVRNFRERTKHLDCDVYFAHILPECTVKGLDDLLCLYPGNEQIVITDLLTLSMAKLFSVQNITDKSLAKLTSYFHIDSPESFYSYYQNILIDKPFVYKGITYQHTGEELEPLVNANISNIVRVGDEYLERIEKPDKNADLSWEFVKRLKSTITDDYGREALKYIKKYKAFCLVPSHTNFQQIVGECFNMYQPLSHNIGEGCTLHTISFLKRIFKDKLDFILDYIQLLYTHPTQNLPILSLVSEEKNTGKSLLGQFLIDIFQGNAVKLGNADLESNFNEPYAEKLVIVVDETSIEKRTIAEAVKRMSTEKGKLW
jgi:hypothetical protein